MIQSARFRCSVESVAMNTVVTYGVAPTHSARTPRAPHRHRTGSRNGGAGACPTSCRVVPVNYLSLDSSRVLCLLRTDGLWRVEGRWRGRRDVTDGEGSSRIPGPGQVLTHSPTHPCVGRMSRTPVCVCTCVPTFNVILRCVLRSGSRRSWHERRPGLPPLAVTDVIHH